jgi:hypothetical protein
MTLEEAAMARDAGSNRLEEILYQFSMAMLHNRR